jgi:hypothetical protein
MAVTIDWQQSGEGRAAVWLIEEGRRGRRLFELGPEAAGDSRAIVEEWAAKSDSVEEFLEMMHLEGFIDLEHLRQLLAAQAPLRQLWEALREFCHAAGDIGEYPATQIVVVPQPFSHDPGVAVLPQEYVDAAVRVWEAFAAGDCTALSHPTLGIVLADVGVLVGRRLGLNQDQAVHFADWLVEAITGWSMSHGNDRTIARLDEVAAQAAYGHAQSRGRAFCSPAFWTEYRPAIPAVVAFLKATI